MITLDFETAYTDTYSLKKMGAWAYCMDPVNFDCYQVAVVQDDKVIYNGHPKGFNWELVRGELLVAHNAGFDGLVFKRLQQDGVIPKDLDNEWVCTADMAVYFQGPRDLKGAAYQLIGMTISKAYRAKAKGKTGAQIAASTDNAEIVEAGADDALAADRIAHKYLPLWPAEERELSRLNREACWYGCAVDRQKNGEALGALVATRQNFLRAMVWATDAEDTPMSTAKIREHGRKVGVPVPACFDSKKKEVKEWYATYGEKHPWVLAVRDYKRVNTFSKKLKTLQVESEADGVYHFSKKYCGGLTGRFSGGGGFNMENLPRKAHFGVDLRSHLVARPGFMFLGGDYAQIEPRLLHWRAGDTAFLEVLEEVGNIYVAYLVKTGRYPKGITKKDVLNHDYQCTKPKVIGLGYGMGWEKYKDTAFIDYGIIMADEQAQADVIEYRNTNDKIKSLWLWHDNWLRVSAGQKDATHEIALRSGRRLVYHNPREFLDTENNRVRIKVQTTRGATPVDTYGGKLTENEIQATARDVLRDAYIGLVKANYRVIMTIHDEFLLEIPESKCNEDTKREVRHIMLNSSPWAKGAPLDVALDEMHYTKCFCK